MRTILLPVHDDAGQNARLRAALDSLRAVDGRLVCIDLVVPDPAGDPFGGIAQVVTERERLRETSNQQRVADYLALEGVDADWIEAFGDPEECLVRAAALSDLIVASTISGSGLTHRVGGLSDALIVRAKRPILAIPESLDGFDVEGHVMIAWDGSRSCIAAMRAAIPLLTRARSIALFEVDDGSVHIPAESGVTYLARYGIVSHALPRHALIEAAGSMIVTQCRRRHPAYLVMGGYGHSRTREALFGGATRTMLREARVPLLLAHE
ncbi:universal stress protein [Sphingomonas abietis]|uniref:Universal stress protein n=1 Tax=Sphingomonas abietis TaxID=3012344 RepID=A0ABY7NHD0_9SPHN|nr:universal stress protein [Sphingomonas abietis]WBO20672.1 universal stress protein [Sphingomonas abietis]